MVALQSKTEMHTPAAVFRARMLLVAASLLWSVAGAIVKSPLLSSIPLEACGPILACFRAMFAGLVLMPFARGIRWNWGLLPAIATFALMNATYVTGMTRTSAAAAIFLQYTSTGWAALMSVLLLKERFDRTTILPLCGAFCGIYWIVAGDSESGEFIGNLLALVSGVFYAGVLVSLRALRNEDSTWLTAVIHLGAGILIAPWALSGWLDLSLAQWLAIAALGALQMGVPYLLFAKGVRVVGTTEAALITVLEPILNPVWVWLVWGQPLDRNLWVGGSLILGTLLAKYGLDAWFARTARK